MNPLTEHQRLLTRRALFGRTAPGVGAAAFGIAIVVWATTPDAPSGASFQVTPRVTSGFAGVYLTGASW